MTQRSLFIVAAVVVLATPADAQTSGADTARTRDALIATDRRVAETSAKEGFRTAMASALADDGALLYAGAPVVHGTKAVAALLAAQPLLDSIVVRWQPLSSAIAADGTMGLTYGITITLERRVADAAPRMGSYAHVWRWTTAGWKLAGAVHINVVPPQRTIVTSNLPIELPPLAPSGNAGKFVAADLAFSRLATTADPGTAFRTNIADDGVTIGGGGLLVRGPEEIGRAFVGGPPVDWSWHPVLAGASLDGTFGFTVGESTSRPRGNASAPANLSKYLSVWRRQADGTVKFIYDGGNPRPSSRAR